VNALDMGLHIAIQNAETLLVRRWRADDPIEPTINPWPLLVATAEIRKALAAFRRREQPEPAKFPTSAELIELAHDGGRDLGLERVHDRLIELEAGPIMT
jgi:hypothetical protein